MSSARSHTGQAWIQLCGLSVRRTLPRMALVLAGVVAASLLFQVWLRPEGGPDERFNLARWASPDRAAALRYFFASQRVWAFATAVLAPFLVWRAAGQASGPVRRADRLWLDVRPAGPFFVVSAQLFGSALAALIGVTIFASAALLAQPDLSATVDAPAGTAVGPPERLVGDESMIWSTPELNAEDVPLRARLALRLVSGGTDPVLNLEFATRRIGASDWSSSLIRVGDGARLEVELPSGGKGAEFKLQRIDGGARALIRSESVQLYRALSTRVAALRIALRILLGTSAAMVLAYALGNFISAASATTAAVLPWFVAVLAPSLPVLDFLPGGDLTFALEEWTEGRAVSALSREAWIGAMALVAFGMTLATFGRRRVEV